MTAQDRQYMVDVDDANLTAFLAWHRDAWNRGVFRDMSLYSQLKMAWMAARNSRWQPPPPAPLPTSMAYSPEGGYEMREEPFRAPVPRMEAPPRRSFNPEFDLRVRPDDHREAQRHVDTQTMPAVTDTKPDPFAAVKLTGPQQIAMDSLYPLPLTPNAVPADFELVDGFGVGDLVPEGPVEPVREG